MLYSVVWEDDPSQTSNLSRKAHRQRHRKCLQVQVYDFNRGAFGRNSSIAINLIILQFPTALAVLHNKTLHYGFG